jgi:hypothetical protein
MTWAVYVAHIGKVKNAYKMLVEHLTKRCCVGELSVDGRIILK